jgi:hypothetical protein
MDARDVGDEGPDLLVFNQYTHLDTERIFQMEYALSHLDPKFQVIQTSMGSNRSDIRRDG